MTMNKGFQVFLLLLLFFPFQEITFAAEAGKVDESSSKAEKPDRLEDTQMDLANGFYLREFHEMAQAEYLKYLEWFPHGAYGEEARFRIADCLKNLGKREEAVREYEKLIQLHGKFFARSCFRLGEMDWEDKKFEAALKKFVKAAENAEETETRLTARFYQARTLMALKREEEARPVLMELARVEDKNPYQGFALLELAGSLESQGQSEEALIFLRKVMKVNASPTLKAEAGMRAGLLEMKLAHWKPAVSLFENVKKLNLSPEWNATANRYLVQAFYEGGQYASVLKILLDAKNEFPPDATEEMKLYHVHSLRQLKKYGEASALYDRFLKDYPNHASTAEILWQKILCDQLQEVPGWENEARRFLDRFKESPRRHYVLYLLAGQAMQKKDSAAALQWFEPLDPLVLPPEVTPTPMYQKGICRMQQKQWPKAIQDFQAFLKKFPYHSLSPSACLELGRAFQETEQPEKAVEAWGDLLRRFPKAAEREEALFLSALTQGNLQQFADMETRLKDFIREFPKSKRMDDVQYWLGWALYEDKKFAEAVPYLQNARKARPADYESAATSRIILALFQEKDRLELMKEIDRLPPNSPFVTGDILFWIAGESNPLKEGALVEKYYRRILEDSRASQWHEGASWNLAEYLQKQSKWKDASAAWGQYRKDHGLKPQAVTATMAQAECLIHFGSFDEATNLIEDLMKNHPEGKVNAEARMLMASLFVEKKMYREAGKYYLSVSILYEDADLTRRSMEKAIENFVLAGDYKQAENLRKELKKKKGAK